MTPTFTATCLLCGGDNKNNEIPQLLETFSPDRTTEIQHND